MDILFIVIIVFLFLLAIFDLSVGVSNDAVNFLNSAIGSKAASFKTVVAVAAVGVFIGAVMSNGMMDIARHGIFKPENFSFYDIICIFMAVMVTDIILLDVFNTLGLPTSTTVSMVFELLGATFAVAVIKIASEETGLSMGELLNTSKALQVIMGIFLSVVIAFIFGMLVQFLTRTLFTFEFTQRAGWKMSLFGGIACTAIIYFMLIKGTKDLTFMTPEIKAYIAAHTAEILLLSFAFFSGLMALLYKLRINVLRVVVLMGTFALAMAFAGNDLVNFIGVPLTGFASWQDFTLNSAGDAHSFFMSSLNGPANTPFYFLLGAGIIMVIALATSRKARHVSKTEIGLASQQEGEEAFGSSRASRRLVRMAINLHAWFCLHTPVKLRRWFDRRFDSSNVKLQNGAAFDLLRGSVNLMLAGMLIALGTSMKLPLSTTFVTFMVAMGTSLADRAWGRESAVFRITGVMSVIGGWFITAGVAFLGAAIIVTIMHLIGTPAIAVAAIGAIVLLIWVNVRHRKKAQAEKGDAMFHAIVTTEDKAEAWKMLELYMAENHKQYLTFARATYDEMTHGFLNDDVKDIMRALKGLYKRKTTLKNSRRLLTLALRHVDRKTAIEKNTYFHMSINSCIAINYNLVHISEVCREHVDNNFRPLPQTFKNQLIITRQEIDNLFRTAISQLGRLTDAECNTLRRSCDQMKDHLSFLSENVHTALQDDDPRNLAVSYVYLNLLQESREIVSNLRKLISSSYKLSN